METKECQYCHRMLPLERFARHIGRPDGRQAWCRECNHRIYMAKHLHQVKWLSHYPDDELADELMARGAARLVLERTDRQVITAFLQQHERTQTAVKRTPAAAEGATLNPELDDER